MSCATPPETVPEPLRPWVARLWTSQGVHAPGLDREHVLPSGRMHLVIRLDGPALRILDDGHHPTLRSIQGPVIGGPRSRFYAKAVDAPVASIGAVLQPGASLALFGVCASELAERHTPLADLIGAAAADTLHAQLVQARGARQQLDLLCRWLTDRSAGASPLAPLVGHALAALARPGSIDALVRASHYSHRGFLAQFKRASGLGPKRLARLSRFHRLLSALRPDAATTPLSELALAHGYSDQPHMNREFRAMAGVTPQQYRSLAPASMLHLPLAVAR